MYSFVKMNSQQYSSIHLFAFHRGADSYFMLKTRKDNICVDVSYVLITRA